MGAEASRKCGRCGVQLSESNMMKHLTTCQKLQATVIRPNGHKVIFEYKGPNNECLTNIANQALSYRDDQSKTLH